MICKPNNSRLTANNAPNATLTSINALAHNLIASAPCLTPDKSGNVEPNAAIASNGRANEPTATATNPIPATIAPTANNPPIPSVLHTDAPATIAAANIGIIGYNEINVSTTV